MKKIVKLLLPLCLAITCLYANDYEQYSDIRPHTQHVFTIQKEKPPYWDCCGANLRIQSASFDIRKLFEPIGFDTVTVGHAGRYNCWTHAFGKYDENHRLVSAMMSQMQCSEVSLIPRFCSIESYSGMFTIAPPSTEMSWRHLSHAFKTITRFKSGLEPDFHLLLDRMKNRVRRKGLENSFIRTVVVVNKDCCYSYNAVFDTEEERIAAVDILTELRDAMTILAGEHILL